MTGERGRLLTDAELAAASEEIERAFDMVDALCRPYGTEGAREWSMSIPARPKHDPDLVIGDGLFAGRRLLTHARLLTEHVTTHREALGALIAWDSHYHGCGVCSRRRAACDEGRRLMDHAESATRAALDIDGPQWALKERRELRERVSALEAAHRALDDAGCALLHRWNADYRSHRLPDRDAEDAFAARDAVERALDAAREEAGDA